MAGIFDTLRRSLNDQKGFIQKNPKTGKTFVTAKPLIQSAQRAYTTPIGPKQRTAQQAIKHLVGTPQARQNFLTSYGRVLRGEESTLTGKPRQSIWTKTPGLRQLTQMASGTGQQLAQGPVRTLGGLSTGNRKETVLGATQTGLSLLGARKLPLPFMAIGGGMSAVASKLQGQNPYVGFGQGVGQSAQIRGVTRYTDPFVFGTAGVAKSLVPRNPITQQAIGRSLMGFGNTVEDEILAKADGIKRGLGDRLLSFGLGAAISSGGTKADYERIAQQAKKKLNLSPEQIKKLDKFITDINGRTHDVKTGQYQSQNVKTFITENGFVKVRGFIPGVSKGTVVRENEFGVKVKPESISPLKETESQRTAARKLPGIMYTTNKKLAEGVSTLGKGKIVLNESKISNTNLGQKIDISVNSQNRLDQSSYGSRPSKLQSPQSQEKVESAFGNIIDKSDIDVKSKMAVWDVFRTPDRVLKKFGLEKESKNIRKQYDTYIKELPQEINKVTEWSKQVAPKSNQRIFKYLDGQNIALDKNERHVAEEIKTYLSEWADKLNLPKEKRISNYITHIFEKDFIKKEFEPEFAALIRDKVAGSVYDPFTSQRLGKQGYLEDTWRALDAYVKRAVRKYNMDPALEAIKDKSQHLEDSQYKYVKSYIDRVNMRPTSIDNIIDNTIKQLVGYRFGQRPTTEITRKLRQMVYRGTLGLNPGSALKNLTQGVNTYAKLGEKYTVLGYTHLVKSILNGSDELEKVGVLKNDFIQDRTLSATHKAWERVDKGLFSFFELAEKINRGSAYYGAKAKALNKGMDETQAIEYAKKIVRDTQFTFGSIDTPPILQGDINKLLLQFQSFNIKQAEFVAEMIKNKEFAGLARYSSAGLLIALTVGKVFGMDIKDFIPFSGVATGQTKLGQTPPIKLGMDIVKTAVGAKDEYGNQPSTEDRIQTLGKDAIPFIPGGVQMKKTIQGLGAVSQGYSSSKTGRIQYLIPQTPSNYIRAGVLGKYTLPQAREYYDKNRQTLSENQSDRMRAITDPTQKNTYYKTVMAVREVDNQQNQLEEMIKAGKYNNLTKGDPKQVSLATYRYIMSQDAEKRKETYMQMKDSLTPEQQEYVAMLGQYGEKGFSQTDMQLGLIPKEYRAQALFERLNTLQPKNRRAKLEQLKDAGFVTEELEAELMKIIDTQGR